MDNEIDHSAVRPFGLDERLSSGQPINVTLVHGTFARKASWILQNSFFQSNLASELGGQVRFHDQFRWSGLPSHLARLKGARDLADYLKQVTSQYDGPHFVAGHSHGSMVALYALKDEGLARQIDGLITLSTPFLIAKRRSANFLGSIIGVAVSVTMTLLALYFVTEFITGHWKRFSDIHDSPYLFIPGFIILFASLKIFDLSMKYLGMLSEWFIETLSIPKIDPERILIIRNSSDEASLFINLSHGFESFISLFWRRETKLDDFIFKGTANLIVWTIYAIFLGIPLLLALAWGLTYLEYDALVNILSYPFDVIFRLPEITLSSDFFWNLGVMIIELFLLLLAVSIISSVSTVPELGLCAPSIAISAESSPIGHYRVMHLDEIESPGLIHSRSYSDPAAITAITVWITALIKKTK